MGADHLVKRAQVGDAFEQDPRSKNYSAFVVGGHTPSVVYFYADAEGNPVAAVARFEAGTLDPLKKQIRQFRYEDAKYEPGLEGLKLPLYGIAEVLNDPDASNKPTFAPEGEKCADVLRANGLLAVTNAGGAEKWRPDHSESVRGLNLVPIPDNDSPGRRHANLVARTSFAMAKSVRIMATPGAEGRDPEDGFDVADWFAQGGTAEELIALARATPPWSPPDAGWPEPTALGKPESAEPFPLETALPPVLRQIAQEVSRTIQVDVTAPAVFIPTFVSMLAANCFSIETKNDYAEPNLARFTVWGKPSGERGTQTFRVLLAPIDAWMDADAERFQRQTEAAADDTAFFKKRLEVAERNAANAKTTAEMQRWREEARTARASIPVITPRSILYIGDTTSEALTRTIHQNGGASAVVCADARHVVDAMLGQYRSDGKTDDSVYLRGHGGDPIDRNRVGTGPHNEAFRIPHPSLALAICIQADKLDELSSRRELMESGMIPRCNMVVPAVRMGTRFETGDELPFDPDTAEAWSRILLGIRDFTNKRLRELGSAPCTVTRLRLSAEARLQRRAFFNEIEARLAEHGDLRGASAMGSKAPGETARLAGLFHLAELALTGQLDRAGEIEVSAETWRYAEVHQRWQIEETLRVLCLANEDTVVKHARRLLKWFRIDNRPGQWIAMRDILASKRVKDKEEAMAALTWLEDRGWARHREAEGKERGERYMVHPLVYAVVEPEIELEEPQNGSALQQTTNGGVA